MFTVENDPLILLGALLWLVLGFVELVLLRGTAPLDRPMSRRSPRLSVATLVWLLVAYPLIAICFAMKPPGRPAPSFDFSVAGAVFGVVFAVCGVALLIRIIAIPFTSWRRRMRQQALLWSLAAAADRGIPLGPVIESFAAEHWGPARWNTQVLARLVAAGTPLPDALVFVGGMVPREALVPIQVGHELGALPAGLRQATAPAGPQQNVWDQLAGKVAYLSVLVLVAVLIVTFIMIKIVPAFQKIFVDFGARLPAITQFIIGACYFLVQYAWPIPILILFLTMYVLFRYLGIISWDLPLVARLTRKMHAATVLEALAMAAERNQPFTRTIATLARCYPKWSIRWRLQGVLVDVTSGANWTDSLRARGFVSRGDRAVLQAAQRVGNLPWALREIADSRRRRLAYRLQASLQILFPVAIVSFGLAVLAFWAACFLPLVALIQKLS